MNKNVREYLHFAIENRKLILWPVVICTVLSFGYALFRSSRWTATQALFVRDEGTGAIERGGRFESVDAMQTAQETIMEVAKHPEVLRAALEKVGPRKRKSGDWPSGKVIEDFREDVAITAPYGAQFGRTEMIYVTVEGSTVERAKQLTSAVVEKLMDRMQLLRVQRYQGMVNELEQAVAVGNEQLAVSSKRLEEMEKEIGMDLAELRVLMDQGQGEGNVRRTLTQIDSELRNAKRTLSTKKNAFEQLTRAMEDPRRLINMPSDVLDGQPTLKSLKQGLADAQLNVSRVMGIKSARHPDTQAAIQAEERIRLQLYRALKSSIATLKNDVAQAEAQVALLNRQHGMVSGRMGGLANIRTRYSNLSNEVRQRSVYLEKVQADLALARTNLLAADNVSLIQTVEEPIPSTRPVGLGRKAIVLGGIFGGVVIGVGLLLLVMPVDDASAGVSGERRIGRWGRRTTDRLWNAFGRRFADFPQPSRSPESAQAWAVPAEERRNRRRNVEPSKADQAEAKSTMEPDNDAPSAAPIPPLETSDWDGAFSAGKSSTN